MASEAVSLLVSLTMLAAPSILPEPWLRAGDSDVLIRAWAATWLALSAALLYILCTSFRRAEPGARLLMVTVPAVWLVHFMLAPGTFYNLLLALITSVALAATLRS